MEEYIANVISLFHSICQYFDEDHLHDIQVENTMVPLHTQIQLSKSNQKARRSHQIGMFAELMKLLEHG